MYLHRTLDLGSATTVIPRMSPAKSRTPVVMLSLDPRRDTDMTHTDVACYRGNCGCFTFTIVRTDGGAGLAEVRQAAVLHAHALRHCGSDHIRE